MKLKKSDLLLLLIDDKKPHDKDLDCIAGLDQLVPVQCSSFHRLVERDWCKFLIVSGSLLHNVPCK